MTILERFFSSVNKLGPFEKNAKIAVAVSGGSDSLALTYMLNKWASYYGLELHAITIDHGLRQESSSEAQQVQKLMRSHSIIHSIISLKEVFASKKNIQGEARRLRYQKLCEYCNANNIYHLFTGHNQNDEIENFFIRLARGTTLVGLKGIKRKLIKNNVRILRPLLSFTKQELEEHLTNYKLKWINDPSNSNTKFLRVIARNLINSQALLNLSNQTDKKILFNRISRVIKNIQISGKKEDDTLLNFLVRNVIIHPAGYGQMLLDNLDKFSQDLVIRSLALLITTISCEKEYHPRYDSLARIYKNIIQGNFTTSTLGKCFIEIKPKHNCLIVTPEPLKQPTKNSSNYSQYLFNKRYLIDKKLSPNFQNKLNKKNSPHLPANIRKILPEIIDNNGKKTIPFVDNQYYTNNLIEFLPQVSLAENTIND